MKKRIILIILLIFAVHGIFTILTALSAKRAISTTQKAVGAIKLQDLDATKAYLKDAKKEFEGTKRLLIVFTPVRYIPLIEPVCEFLEKSSMKISKEKSIKLKEEK